MTRLAVERASRRHRSTRRMRASVHARAGRVAVDRARRGASTRRRRGRARANATRGNAVVVVVEDADGGTAPRVLFENEAVVVVDKPPGMSFHSERGPGALQTTRASRGEGGGALLSVHRLDKPTSGILVFAKTPEARDALSRAFEEKKIVKYYVGVSAKRPKKKMGTVLGDMKQARRKAYMLTPTTENPAETKFVSFGALGSGGRAVRMFVFRPLTGKTHQLRVTAKSLGSALLGDDTYGGESGVDRMYLHACAMRIPASVGIGPAIQIICSPVGSGDEWDSAAFERYFPETLANDMGAWFNDQPLLRSTIDQ